MDHRATLILAASLLCGSAHATYATLSPPVGWSAGVGASVATYAAPAVADLDAIVEATVRSKATLPVNGARVTVPANIPIVKSAIKKVAAAAIFAHPGLRTAAAVATWIGAAGLVYDVADGVWKRLAPDSSLSDGYEYLVESGVTGRFLSGSSPEDACNQYVTEMNASGDGTGYTLESASSAADFGGCIVRRNGGGKLYPSGYRKAGNCLSGWYYTPAGCVKDPPMQTVDKDKFVEIMQPDPRVDVDDLPNVVWPASWPVELPQVQPMFIPTGNPVPNPSYDSSKAPSPTNQPFNQPGVKVTPAPTTANPWQVDLQPVNRPVDSPNPNPEPKVDPPAEPGGDGNGDKPRDPEKDTQDLCEKHPEIIACQKLDEPEDPGELKTKAVDLDFQVQGGYAGAAVCPAPMTYEAFGHVLSLSWQPFCDSLSMVKNLLLAFAWISAAFILLGAKKE